jgi:hypothetical protein
MKQSGDRFQQCAVDKLVWNLILVPLSMPLSIVIINCHFHVVTSIDGHVNDSTRMYLMALKSE